MRIKQLVSISLLPIFVCSLIPSISHAQASDTEFEAAVTRMYEQGLTKYETTAEFGADEWLTREQAAKFFAVFMTDVLEKTDILDESACEFDDAGWFDYTLALHIDNACELGLFKGSNNMFMPREPLTKAAALTVLVRAMEGSQQEDIDPWWSNYFTRSRLLGLTKELNVWALDRPITRYEIALLLYRAEHGGVDNEQEELNELMKLLLELGLQTK